MAINKRIIRSNDEAAGGASFNTVLYDGDGAATKQITGVGFQPDLVWIKGRTPATFNHVLSDSVRGSNAALYSNSTNAELSPSNYGAVGTFDADGFTTANGTGGSIEVNYNVNNQNYVAWCWKAGGAAVTNTDGTITSQVSANTEAGFSIVSYTGNGVSGATIGHGLSDEPKIFIVKRRDLARSWHVLGSVVGLDKYLLLDTTDALASAAGYFPLPNNTVINYGTPSSSVNVLNGTFIAYCFAEVAGFSKFGSYVGNGSTNGPIIDCGFEPALVVTKMAQGIGSNWWVHDNKRDTSNPRINNLRWNLPDAEQVNNTDTAIDFNSNGFQIKTSYIEANNSGDTFIYMAFANQF